MPELCKAHDLTSSLSECPITAGLKAVKYVKGSELDLVGMNTALSTYFDTATYQFKAVAPLLLSGGDGWALLKHDAAGAQRVATSPDRKPYFDVNITNLRFQGYMDTKKVAESKRLAGFVSVTLLQDGTRIMDGLTYDPDEGKLVIDYNLDKLRFGEVVESSGVFDDEIGMNTLMSITGRTQHKGYQYLGAWTLLV